MSKKMFCAAKWSAQGKTGPIPSHNINTYMMNNTLVLEWKYILAAKLS